MTASVFIQKVREYIDDHHPLWTHIQIFDEQYNQRDDVLIAMASHAGLWDPVDSKYFGSSALYVNSDSNLIVRRYTQAIITFLYQVRTFQIPDDLIQEWLDLSPEALQSRLEGKDLLPPEPLTEESPLWQGRLWLLLNATG